MNFDSYFRFICFSFIDSIERNINSQTLLILNVGCITELKLSVADVFQSKQN
jgi:hypothetical protein